jgi:hypothetical protein
MLGRPIIPHHDRSWPPFHPQLISRVLNTAIKTTNHGIEFVGCQLTNRFSKGRIHLANTGKNNGLTGGHFARKLIFKCHD